MAEKDNYGGLSSVMDMSKINPYGVDDERLKELRDAQQNAITALQQRYENPNWFKVAAGFLKPQLGGFMASLGSASEALGENVEQQRAQQLPISQMKIQMAQQNLLLSNKQKASSIISKAQSEGRKLTPKEMIEVTNLDPERGKILQEGQSSELQQQSSIQKQQELEQGEQRLILDAIHSKQAANIPLSAWERSYISNVKPVQRNIGTDTSTETPTAPAPTTVPITPTTSNQNRIYVLGDKNQGARVTEDVYNNLVKNGVPVISNMRTQEEQEALKDHQDANGNWYTKEGRPVAKDVSKHGLGDALDVDSNKLTDEHKKILKDKGWHQPDWALDRNSAQYDPNHWEKINAPAKEETPVKTEATQPEKVYPHSVPMPNTQGIGDADRQILMKNYADNAAKVEAPYAETVGNLQAVTTGPNFTRIKNSYDTAINMIEKNPDLAKKVFAMVRQDPILAALNKGFGVHAGAFNANVSLPIDAFLDAGLGEREKNYADKLFSSLMNITMANLRSQGVAMGKVPQQEYMKALSGFVSPDQTAPAALNLLHHSRADFDQSKEYYDILQKDRREHVDPRSATPYADIHNSSSELQKLHKKYAEIHRRYDDDYQKRLNAKKSQESGQ